MPVWKLKQQPKNLYKVTVRFFVGEDLCYANYHVWADSQEEAQQVVNKKPSFEIIEAEFLEVAPSVNVDFHKNFKGRKVLQGVA